MAINDDFILRNIENFEIVSVSTNKVYRFQHENDTYILKINNISSDNLSPFWRGMKEVFASDFDTQRENIEETLSMLSNPHIQAAQLITKSHKSRFQIFKQVEGFSYEPDEFPSSNDIEYQLGQFIGYIHSTQYEYFGHQKLHFRSAFKEKMFNAMSETMKRHWSDSHEVKVLFEKIRCLNVAPDSYSLIMPDISANQFIFDKNLTSIRAVVDFDAYVIGPREWELSVLELCLQNGRAFKKGYEEYNLFPDISKSRDFYRFFMYLCDLWNKQDLTAFMNQNILF